MMIFSSAVAKDLTIKSDAKNEIKPFDFNAAFEEAEKYYRLSKSWKRLKCEAKTHFFCNKKECVKKTDKSKSFLILDKENEVVMRCLGEKCDKIKAEFNQVGVFFNIQSDEQPFGVLVRVLGDSRYKEITTIGLDAYIANGNCQVMVEK